MQKAYYSPPWANTSIIGIAGSSGSGKTSLSHAIVQSLNLPWVVILSMDSFYKVLTPEQSAKAFQNEFDFDSPDALDFDVLVEKLRELKTGKKVEIPIYSFEKHARLEKTHTLYSPHVLILEGIFALHDPRVLEMLDLRIFAEADADLCLSRRLLRDVRERGRDIEGCIKQWFAFVKPNFARFVERQRETADIIVPRGIENAVAIRMVSEHIRRVLADKSALHRQELRRLGAADAAAETASALERNARVLKLPETPQVRGVYSLLVDPETPREDFIFYFDRIAALLVEHAASTAPFVEHRVRTPQGTTYAGLRAQGVTSAVVLLRGGATMERGLRRVLPDCMTGRLLIQTSVNTAEPELHFTYLPDDIASHATVLLMESQMSSGGAALMAVKVLVDHGVREDKIVLVTFFAGRLGLGRLLTVFPEIKVVVGRIGEDMENRWMEIKYLGC